METMRQTEPSKKSWRYKLLISIIIAGIIGLFLLIISQLPPKTAKYKHPGEIATVSVENPETQWPVFGRDNGGSQYSPLEQITTDNVRGLKVAWEHHSGDLNDDQKDKRKSTAYEVTPIHANNMLYYCTPLNRVFALDPVTGEENWVFDPHEPDPISGKPLVGKPKRAAFCRGVTYWENDAPTPNLPCQKRIFRSDNFGQTYAIDADTGLACQDFGANLNHPGFVSNWDYPVNGDDMFRGTTSPPAVIGNVLVTASGANDSTAKANDGVIRGWDTLSGELLWEFNPIPEAHREATGAGNVWGVMTVDEDLGLIYLPTTSPSPDFYGGTRQFDMPHVSAIVALRADTGEVEWSFQTVRHDLFDFDHGAHPLLVTIQKDGKAVDAAILQTKMGWVFAFDRATGEPLWPIEERPVPASTIPGDVAALTQPVPVGIDAFTHQTMERDEVWGLTPFDKAWCKSQYDKHRYEGMYTPPSPEGTVSLPAVFGGGNWGGAAYDPDTNILVVKSQNLSMILTVKEMDAESESKPTTYSSRPLGGTPYHFSGEPFLSPFGIPCNAPPWGTLTAINMDTGKTVWTQPFGQSKRFGILVPHQLGWGAPNVAGPLITGGGLVFAGATMDGIFRAFDVKTGEEVWRDKLPAPGIAVPMTYYANDRQFVVIAAGGAARVYNDLDDAIIAYTLQ